MNRIREKRLEAGLSQVRLSILTGVPNSAISDVELGKRQAWPRLRHALAKALRCPESELFPGQGGKDGK
jgi:transcriptional regulator with XRE-family HTH domain